MSNRERGASAPLFLLTVPHTGTNTAIRILAPDWFDHVFDDRRTVERIDRRCAECAVLVTTMRNPVQAATGWMKRGRDLAEFFPMWGRLMDWREKAQEAFWLPVDAPDRDDYLAAIGERIGKDLQTDWPMLNHRDQPEIPDKDYTLDDVRTWARQSGIFDQFGYEI